MEITELARGAGREDLVRDVVRGFAGCPRSLPPKYFYDEVGGRLFDAICSTPEYYLTRTEQGILDRVAGELVGDCDTLVELGSGAARKTRTLLQAMHRQGRGAVTYVPVDISREMLVHSSGSLLADHPWLRVHGLVADLDHHLHLLPRGGRRLIAYLGSSIGNFLQPDAIRLAASLARGMGGDDRLLIGFDLVKSPAVLHAAYNDAAGLTAAFNRNLLHVVNRMLDADFIPDRFDHLAFYAPERRWIEMHLVSRRTQTVELGRIGKRYTFATGERLHTEISRKFERADVDSIAAGAGLRVDAWHTDADAWFALVLLRRA